MRGALSLSLPFLHLTPTLVEKIENLKPWRIICIRLSYNILLSKKNRRLFDFQPDFIDEARRYAPLYLSEL